MSTPIVNRPALLPGLLAVALLWAPTALAAQKNCEEVFNSYNAQIDEQKNARDQAADADKPGFTSRIQSISNSQWDARRQCEADNKADQEKEKDLAKSQEECQEKASKFPDVYSWDAKKKRCVNKADVASSRSAPTADDCSSASVFAGDLKGQNCKKAMDAVRDVRARNGALTDATTAATTVYSSMQAGGATGAQDDAQVRQANIMKTLAMSKMLTGALNLAGAMQLKSAASGAEDANSTITGAQKQIQQACANETDDQACFYQNASKYGITPDQRSYASFSRMRQGAQQAQDQADAANSLAKSSMLSGAADVLVGMQALKAAQMASNNAGAMAPPPMMVGPAPPQRIALGGDAGGPAAPSLTPGTAAPLADYGNPGDNNTPFGAQKHGRIDGALAGKMGAPNIFKSASSGVSGGGGAGGGVGGGGGLKGGGGAASRKGGPRNSTAGEYNLGGGGGGGKGAVGASGAEKDNPLADMLAKMFPQSQDGKTVVDSRQVASAAGGALMEDEQRDPTVTASDLSIFEQITAKYRQLNNSGRF